MKFLIATVKKSFCEWKGLASYWTVIVGDQVAANAAWSYESPNPQFSAIEEHLAFFPDLLECYIDDNRVQPQPGGFYGGWITSDVVGPFKGIRGSSSW